MSERLLYAVVLPLGVLILSAIPWLMVRTVVTQKAQTLYSKSGYKKVYKQVLKRGISGQFSLRSLWNSLTMLPWWQVTRSPELLRRLIVYWCYCGAVLAFCAAMVLSSFGLIYHRALFWPYLVFKGLELAFCLIWPMLNGTRGGVE